MKKIFSSFMLTLCHWPQWHYARIFHSMSIIYINLPQIESGLPVTGTCPPCLYLAPWVSWPRSTHCRCFHQQILLLTSRRIFNWTNSQVKNGFAYSFRKLIQSFWKSLNHINFIHDGEWLINEMQNTAGVQRVVISPLGNLNLLLDTAHLQRGV